jgi:pilus assembly protein Flp/PilA
MGPLIQKSDGSMKSRIGKIIRFLKTADGPTAVEYGVILALIFLVCISAVVMLGKSTQSSFQHSSDQIQSSFGQGN